MTFQIPSKLLLVAFAAIFYVVHNVFPEQQLALRSLEALKGDFVAVSKPNICEDTTYRRLITSKDYTDERPPLHKKARYALHVGYNCFGQTNNQILSIFNAIDGAKHSGGMTVVAVSGNHLKLLEQFFPDQDQWDMLERDLPVTRYSDNLNLTLKVLPLDDTDSFLRKSEHFASRNEETWEVEHKRREEFLHYLFSNLDGPSCNYLHDIQNTLEQKFGTSKYIAIHVRNFEGRCDIFGSEIEEQCEMTPTFIKNVLTPTGLYGELPLVVLSDMQNQTKVRIIQAELQDVFVPQWDLNVTPSILDDMVVGAMSEAFLGNQGSSVSRNTAELREALGKDPVTNLVFLEKDETGQWKARLHVNPHKYEW